LILGAGRAPLPDRRLLSLDRRTRHFLVATAALGTASACFIIWRAVLIAHVVAGAFRGVPLRDLQGSFAGLAAVTLATAVMAWGTEVAAHHSAAGAKSALRRSLLRRVAEDPGPGGEQERAGALVAAAVQGIEALDDFFARYLPQLALAVAVPALVVAWMAPIDIWAALIVATTLPLVPLFASLVGRATRARTARRWQAFSDLGASLVDSLRALPTMKVFGRGQEQIEAFSRLAERHRHETMGALRVAFLSAFVLELAATISVAVVAVAMGLRVLFGGIGLEAALTVLLLAPEAYLPPRRLATEFHAAAEGIEAAGLILNRIESAGHAPAGRSAVLPSSPPSLSLAAVTVRHRDRRDPALEDLWLQVDPGEYVAIAGPSGSGKTSLAAVLMGLTAPDSGRVEVGGTDLARLDPAAWRSLISWVPQHPYLFHGSIADNVRFGAPHASDAAVRLALEEVAAGFVEDLSEGIYSPVGESGALLSAGERARIALARALIRPASLLILDEPTAHLDALTEIKVLDAIDRRRGRTTVLLMSHRPAAYARADRVVFMKDGRIAADRLPDGTGT
jgi:ATP-binding cassette subfamily C protein CydCD